MRIWSIHPQYLDTKGLVALWRETLLAKHVLEGKTKGYKNHPQLIRFKATMNPSDSINYYLSFVFNEALKRGYNFDNSKINWNIGPINIAVTKGQMEYEKKHLLKKLQIRDIYKYNEVLSQKIILSNPMFTIVKGEVEDWEKVD